jgi:hypothetical protein
MTIAWVIAISAQSLASPGDDDGRRFWAFRPPTDPTVPIVTDGSWCSNAVDRFLLAHLETSGLEPAPAADPRTLIRRVTFDLTGLPPTPEEIDAFVADAASSPGTAWSELVDRLLDSPHYGEQWARHWFDVVRYAETEGFEYDRPLSGMWRYRDWVIDALNRDKPYDRFLVEQIAGDELAGETDDRDLLIAAGFHRLGPVRRNAGNQAVASSRNEVLTERTDIIGSAFLGLTLGCARCHDHKFDPISQRDYYGLQAVFAASRQRDVPLTGEKKHAEWKSTNAAIDAEVKNLEKRLEKAEGEDKKRLKREVDQATKRRPPPLPTIATVENDFSKSTPIHVLLRGEWAKKGESVEPSAPEVFEKRIDVTSTADGRGVPKPRLALARWITSERHPLTARVIVNRVWQYHFGRGIVDTPNNFGRNGGRPSHPELLDWLAHRFVESGWRLKSLHRLILHSSAYRQASRSPRAVLALERDPENRLLWRFRRRRLSGEEIRDTMLEAAGALNRQRGGPSVIVPVERELVDLLYNPKQWTVTPDKRQHARRSIYLHYKRNLQLPFMESFDQPKLQTSCERRESSTHVRQALELLNGDLSSRLAARFATRLRNEADGDTDAIVERAFRLACGRAPNADEQRLCREFVESDPLEEFALAVFNLNAFLYVD